MYLLKCHFCKIHDKLSTNFIQISLRTNLQQLFRHSHGFCIMVHVLWLLFVIKKINNDLFKFGIHMVCIYFHIIQLQFDPDSIVLQINFWIINTQSFVKQKSAMHVLNHVLVWLAVALCLRAVGVGLSGSRFHPKVNLSKIFTLLCNYVMLFPLLLPCVVQYLLQTYENIYTVNFLFYWNVYYFNEDRSWDNNSV